VWVFILVLQLNDLTLHAGAGLAVNEASTVQTNGTTDIANSTMLLGSAFATYDQKGGWLMLTNMSNITTVANSTLSLYLNLLLSKWRITPFHQTIFEFS
jgi:hypothetical protein